MKDIYRNRQFNIQVFFLIAAAILLFKAMQIQLLDTSYQKRAQATAMVKYVMYPSRGLIYDRNGKLLVNNNAMYDLRVTYKDVNSEMDTMKLCDLLDITREEFLERLDKDWKDQRYSTHLPFTFMSKISARRYTRLQEHLHEFPGFSVQLRNVRGYPYKNAPHVLGYLNEVNQVQLEKLNGYSKGDYIGASGLELAYEDQLRGRKGSRYVLKDNFGREVGSFKNGKKDTVAISGYDLITSLDIDLQSYGEELLQNKIGSVVALEPNSGEILAMVSTPTYDPNLLTINRSRGQAFSTLLQDTLKPFFDRSVMAKYPPGSIFKSVVALIAMQEGLLNPNRGITCNAGYYYKGQRWGCHGHIHPYNVSTAIEHSCNTYFFTVLRDIVDKEGFSNPHAGLKLFDDYLYRFGLGQPLGVDVPNELNGNVPTPGDYDKLYPRNKGSWRSPTIMSIGIGQGEIQMTTLQMANLAAIMANRGWYITPHLAKGFRNAEIALDEEYRTRKYVGVDAPHFEPVIEGMEKVLISGTAKIARIKDLVVCGKTGTSQNPHGKDHSVFFAFAPKDNPKIAIAVYVEHGIWGATYAAPIASLMIEKYLKGQVDDSRQWLEDRMTQANLVDNP